MVTPEREQRYTFHPLERRGLILGLDALQLATVAAGTILALIAHAAVPGTAGSVAAAGAFASGVAGSVWHRGGQPLVEWIPVGARWIAGRGALLVSDLPQEGAGIRAAGARGGGAPQRAGATSPAGIALAADCGLPGEGEIGVVHDRSTRRLSAVLPVAGRSFSLMDAGEQAQILERWRSVLGALARPGTPVARLQWIVRSFPAGEAGGVGYPPSGGTGVQGLAAESYAALVDETVPAMRVQEAWLVLTVAGGRGRAAATAALRRELRLLEGQLRSADLSPGRPADLAELRALVCAGYRHGVPAGAAVSARTTWPLALREGWGDFHVDGSWHATYWIAEWPRVEVGPDFLGPLLCGPGRRTVSVVMAAVPPERALREVRSARTADVADAELRSRAGFLASARREREAQGVVRREQELADGHSEFRFSGYLTVSATDRDGLAGACAEAEHSAQAARVELRRLYGRQKEAFSWTQPFGRGLR